MSFLPGMKTHIVAVLMLAVGIIQAATGDAAGWAAIAENLNWFLQAAGLSALRLGVAKR